MIPRIVVLADDMTGALEAGAAFAAAGIQASVSTLGSLAPALHPVIPDALVIDTESRHLPVVEARRRIESLAAEARAGGAALLFKKTDSTLRGNIAAEIAGTAAAWSDSPVIYLAAYPRLGRTVRRGTLFVEGTPVSETEFGRDRWNPVLESHIPTLLRSGGIGLPVIETRPEDIRKTLQRAVYVVDGETEEEVRSSVEALAERAEPFVLAGPAGLAHHVARTLERSAVGPPKFPVVFTGLVVNGSLHPVSARQVEEAVAEGMTAVEADVLARGEFPGAWAVLRQPDLQAADGLEYARKLGIVVAPVLARANVGALVVFGGDTVFGILTALGNPPLDCVGEVVPGVPAAIVPRDGRDTDTSGTARELLLVTKAGGFGPKDVILRIRDTVAGR